MIRRLILLTSAPVLLSACAANAPTDGAIGVTSTDERCQVSVTEADSGSVTFTVSNEGTQVTEFYLLAEDRLRVIGEAENIAPGLTRDLVVLATPGQYYTSCKPGQVGEGIQASFTVNDSGAELTATGTHAEQISAGTRNYAAYVRDQTAALVADTDEFAAAYIAGNDDLARELYASTRMHWERVEPVAESFGDLDPQLDLREADLEPGQEWTGWHRIEKDLWPPSGYTPMTTRQRAQIAETLVADTAELKARVQDLTFTADQLGNGAKELLDEVATGKVTGEEEIWSHTDLWDFQANIDGARVMFENLEPVLQQRYSQLAAHLREQFEQVQSLLDLYRRGDGFVLYTQLSPKQVKELAIAVDALGEPLSQLTSAVLG